MLKVLILHGWHGSDLPHWQAWLAQELVLENVMVAFPQLSNNLFPDKAKWVDEASAIIESLKPDVVVAHSLGNILWFHLCETMQHRVKRLLLCAVPRDLSEFSDVATFFPSPLPDDLHADEILMVASDNDPYMEIDEAKLLSAQLKVELKVMDDAGHINASSGFGPWPWIKEWVLS